MLCEDCIAPIFLNRANLFALKISIQNSGFYLGSNIPMTNGKYANMSDSTSKLKIDIYIFTKYIITGQGDCTIPSGENLITWKIYNLSRHEDQ